MRMHLLKLDGRDVSDRLQQPSVIEPVHPVEGRELDVLDVAPRTAAADDFGLEQADDGLGQGVVVRVADTAHRGLDTRLEESFRVTDREVLHAAIAVVDEPVALRSRLQSLLEGIQRQVAAQGSSSAPAHDHP